MPLQDVRVDLRSSPIPSSTLPLPKAGASQERSGGFGSSSSSSEFKEKPSSGTGTGGEEEVSVLALAKRVAADQIIMAPISLFVFLMSMSLMEGLDGEGTREKFKNYLPILLVNWQVR